MDIRGEIGRSLGVIFNYALTEAAVTRDEDESKIGGQVPGPGFPKHISNAWITYRVPSGKLKGIGASIGYQYQAGRQNFLSDYRKLDGNLSWQLNQVTVSLNANNILDEYLYSGAPYEYNNDASSTEYYFQAEAGINFRLSIAYRF
jgi:iron complex outermembrane receptor protein